MGQAREGRLAHRLGLKRATPPPVVSSSISGGVSGEVGGNLRQPQAGWAAGWVGGHDSMSGGVVVVCGLGVWGEGCVPSFRGGSGDKGGAAGPQPRTRRRR